MRRETGHGSPTRTGSSQRRWKPASLRGRGRSHFWIKFGAKNSCEYGPYLSAVERRSMMTISTGVEAVAEAKTIVLEPTCRPAGRTSVSRIFLSAQTWFPFRAPEPGKESSTILRRKRTAGASFSEHRLRRTAGIFSTADRSILRLPASVGGEEKSSADNFPARCLGAARRPKLARILQLQKVANLPGPRFGIFVAHVDHFSREAALEQQIAQQQRVRRVVGAQGT